MVESLVMTGAWKLIPATAARTIIASLADSSKKGNTLWDANAELPAYRLEEIQAHLLFDSRLSNNEAMHYLVPQVDYKTNVMQDFKVVYLLH